jgi:hypothetical protein
MILQKLENFVENDHLARQVQIQIYKDWYESNQQYFSTYFSTQLF